MIDRPGKLCILAAVACLLPLATAAEEPATEAGEPRVRPEPEIVSMTGRLTAVGKQAIEVERMGVQAHPDLPPRLRIEGGPDTPVSGNGKSRWDLLARGDLVAVAFTKDDPPRAAKVLVLPPSAHPLAAAALGYTPRQKARQRRFTGWIKLKEDDLLVVRTPDPPPPRRGRGEVKEFVRHEGTVVTLGRDSWEDLRKGDRVVIDFSKGNPRPADRIAVVHRGGEKPLPPGLASRLFDRRYDRTVRDVDGIGEVEPGATWEPAVAPPEPGSAGASEPAD